MTAHDHSHASHGHEGGHAHSSHTGQYFAVFVALCVLSAMSFLTYTDFWRERFPVEAGRTFMMAVSCTKAMLVILFFMHVKHEANWKYVLTIPPAIMAVFLMLALVPDIGLRARKYSPEREARMADKATTEPADATQYVEPAADEPTPAAH
ncbi:MAG: cytochrome C oxidase subunit IV family protein [Planctomycetia bacterium]|nr:cytochrome C oxidase subunit IV family protein [Planctomycetia bacterium]